MTPGTMFVVGVMVGLFLRPLALLGAAVWQLCWAPGESRLQSYRRLSPPNWERVRAQRKEV